MRILLGEEPNASHGSVRDLLGDAEHEIILCSNGIEAVRKAFSTPPDLIVLNVHLPRLNGYQCSRLLKQDPALKTVPVIHTAPSGSPVDRFWSRVCHADHYLTTPVDAKTWEDVLRTLEFKERPGRHRISRANVVPELDDHGILMMAGSLLEQDLLRATVLNEINRIDTWDVTPQELVGSLLALIHSLYPFSGGAALLISDNHGDLYAYGEAFCDQGRMDEIRHLMIQHLWERHAMLLNREDMAFRVLETPLPESGANETGELYMHSKEAEPVYSVLLFENMNVGDLNKDEQEVLSLALELVHGVLEKKIFARKSQELSIIDMATKGYSMTFFMEVLEREIANAKRNHYGITLITVIMANFNEITQDLHVEDEIHLIRIMQNAILRTLRKTDIIARWGRANFAFLLTHTSLENAKNPILRVQQNIQADILSGMPSLNKLVPHIGMSELDLGRDQTAESFFHEAMPGASAANGDHTRMRPRTILRREPAPEKRKANEQQE
ncbi:MAG: diguanylate cyclase [Deltaproteobacteria bacterium]|nr:diguanylate cyclase [Deltaproteobacteria bacterium]